MINRPRRLVDSLDFQQLLERVGIITNRNMIPFDQKSAWRPSGMRLGTAALTSRGLSVQQAKQLGVLIGNLVSKKVTEDEAKQQVLALASSLKWYYPEPPKA